MLRKVVIAVAIAVILAPAAMLAQSQLSAAAISGRAIDAAGRGVGSQRVELVEGSHIVATTQTTAMGDWSFANVKPGEYTVRMNIMGRLTGVRVSVIAGQALAGTTIVVSTASVSPQLGTLASLLTGTLPTIATTVAATSVAASIDTETTELDDDIVEDIFKELAAEHPQFATAFAQAILNHILDKSGNSPFSQYVDQLNIILATGGAVIPDFPEPKKQAS